MVNDWDLQAVVRGCSSMSSSSTTTATTSSTTSLIADFQSNVTNNSPFYTQQLQDQIFSTLTNPTCSRTNLVGELHELYRPFFPKSDQLTLSLSPQSTTSSLSSISAFIEQNKSTKQHKQQQENQTKHSHVPSVINLRSKKRKNQLKRICQVPAENVSLDIWSWRKYGQKPIKGSPYPRGYYKCSSSKGCLARKQVEMNRSNPTMFTVTYTADHNHSVPTHRNSLAGSTRQKSVTDGDSIKSTIKSLSPATSLEENLVLPESTDIEEKLENLLGDEEEEDEHGFSDMTVSDDFFMGLEGLVVPATKDYFSDH